VYVPSRNAVRIWQTSESSIYAPAKSGSYWRPVSVKGRAALGRAVARLKPFSPPRAWR
jgi:hypothetical protein